MARQAEKNKILLVVLILIVLLAGLFFVRAQRERQLMQSLPLINGNDAHFNRPSPATADIATAVIRLVPRARSVKIGEDMTVAVELDAQNKQIDGADIYLRYDPAALTVTDITVGSYFSSYPRKTIDNINGTVKVTGYNTTVSDPLTTAQQLFTVQLKGKQPGQTELSVDFVRGKTNKSNIVEHKTSRNILGTVENAKILVEE